MVGANVNRVNLVNETCNGRMETTQQEEKKKTKINIEIKSIQIEQAQRLKAERENNRLEKNKNISDLLSRHKFLFGRIVSVEDCKISIFLICYDF